MNKNTPDYWDYVYSVDCGTDFKACYRYDTRRFEAIFPYLQGTVLDYGCGLGHFSHFCKGRGIDIDGSDFSEFAVSKAKEYNPSLVFFLSRYANLSSYDTVSLQEVIEHMDDPNEFLDKVKGRIIVTTPLASLGGPLHSAEHVREYTMGELSELLEERFKILEQFTVVCSYGTGIVAIGERK